MAREIYFPEQPTGLNVCAVLYRNGLVYSVPNSGFVTPDGADVEDYEVAVLPDSNGWPGYYADRPAGITATQTFDARLIEKSGGALTLADVQTGTIARQVVSLESGVIYAAIINAIELIEDLDPATSGEVAAAIAAGFAAFLNTSLNEATTAATVMGALNAARVQGFGQWDFDVNTLRLTLYRADGTTPAQTFILDSATAPTQRVPE